MERILNLSHIDLDGIAAALAIRSAHPDAHVTTRFVNYDNVHQELKRGLSAKIPYDVVILSDISIKTPKEAEGDDLVAVVSDLIKDFVNNGGRFVVLDHHGSALPMRGYFGDLLDSASILETHDAEGIPRAGSELAARYLQARVKEFLTEELEEQAPEEGEDENDVYEYVDILDQMIAFCEIAGDYDTWRDPLGFGGKLALAIDLMDDPYWALQDLEDLLVVSAISGLSYEDVLPNIDTLDYYYQMASDKLEGAIALAQRTMVKHHDRIHQIQAKFFPNECAMSIYEKSKGVVVVTYPGSSQKLSFRRHKSVGIDLEKFCGRFGGGGHAMAAGVTLKDGVTIDQVLTALREEIEKVS